MVKNSSSQEMHASTVFSLILPLRLLFSCNQVFSIASGLVQPTERDKRRILPATVLSLSDTFGRSLMSFLHTDTSTMGAVAGAVGGGLVIGAIAVVVLLFKTGRLKPCRNGNSNDPPPGVGSTPAAAPATSSAISGTQLPPARQYPVPLQM